MGVFLRIRTPMRRLLPAALLACIAAPVAASDTLLDCGRFFDADQGRMLGARAVLVREGRIAEVLAQAPEGFEGTRIDLSQHTCLPGLIDLHTHLNSQPSAGGHGEGFRLNPTDYALRAAANAKITLEAGFTTVRDLGDRDNVTIALRTAIEDGILPGPRILTAAKSLATTGGHADPTNGWRGDLAGDPGPREGVINSPEEGRKAVRQRYKDGADWIKITATGGVLSYARSGDNPQFTIPEIEEIVATARDYGYKVAAHAHGKEGMRRAILAGVATIEHGTYMDEEIFALMKQHGTVYVPTITAGAYVSEMSAVDGFYPEIVRPKAAAIGPLIKGTFARAYEAGVPIAFGTDAGVFPHGDNAREFELMTEAGMPMAEALVAATRSAARVLDLGAEIGSIATGKRADIIAVSGNPLDDVSAMRQVIFVMKDGLVQRSP
jgi:imidazolonepropionase-like amidohydrolase